MSEHNEGGDALIHLRVSAALKGRWVRESRAAGQRLTDWIIERVERAEAAMTAYPIPDTLADHYHGAGWALVAIAGGQLVALRYLADAAGESWQEQIEQMGPHGKLIVRQWLETAEAGRHVHELQALGEVSVGMCSCWEFVEL